MMPICQSETNSEALSYVNNVPFKAINKFDLAQGKASFSHTHLLIGSTGPDQRYPSFSYSPPHDLPKHSLPQAPSISVDLQNANLWYMVLKMLAGYFVPDVIVAATIGVVTGWCMGPLVPLIGHFLARSFVIQCCLHLSVAAMALSSQFFPYSTSAPKRVVLQHTYRTADVNRVGDSSYDFAVVDSNSLPFLFKYSPKAANLLEVGSQLSAENSIPSNQDELVALFPVSYLLYGGVKFHTKEANIFKHYTHLPYLFSNKQTEHYNPVSRRIFLELYLGSLQEVWVSVLNITGPLSRWSFADNAVPDPERINGGPPSYICRLSGRGNQNWTFWLEANSSESLRVDLAVADQYLGDATRKLKGAFPDWVDVVAYSSYLSSYFF